MKIGDRIYVRGYVDEIRKDTVIVRNNGGYFGTIPSEVITGELPSAQPETHEERTETHACDCISRQAAIDAIVNTVSEIWNHDSSEVARYGATFRQHEILDIIESLPSVQPRKGKWIDYSDEGYVECPFCHSATNCDGNKDELHYCFSCGAELRGDNDVPESIT